MPIGKWNDICETCKKVLSDEDLPVQEKHRLAIDIDICLINKCNLPKLDKKDLKRDRKTKLEEFTKYVTAVKNSGGGALFVHIQGLHKDDRCFSYFNELIDDTLTNLLENGELFVDSYTKRWLPTETYRDFLVVTVEASRVLSTADFKTKVTSDESITRPTSKNVALLLFGKKRPREKPTCRPKLRGIVNIPQESHQIQLKYFENSLFVKDFRQGECSIALHYIWNDLRLKEYFTTFSKSCKGGSYYLGVREVDHAFEHIELQRYNYNTKKNKITGIEIRKSLHEQFLAGLQKVVQDSIFAPFEGDFDVASLYKAKFHLIPNAATELYVLEVAVGYVPGCVFYAKEGPEAYRILDNGEIERLSFEKWKSKIEETVFCERCIAE